MQDRPAGSLPDLGQVLLAVGVNAAGLPELMRVHGG
jgi:hypothetical protein